jgi:hypothetical protein
MTSSLQSDFQAKIRPEIIIWKKHYLAEYSTWSDIRDIPIINYTPNKFF